MTKAYDTKVEFHHLNEKNSLNKEENTIKETSPSSKRFHNDKLMITSVIFASVMTFLIYTVPDWVFLEIPIRDLVHILLSLIGIVNDVPSGGTASVYWNSLNPLTDYSWYAVANNGILESPRSSTWSGSGSRGRATGPGCW